MFVDVFNDLLAENNLSKKKFSEKSGIPYPTIIGWTNLNRLPDFTALKRIADFFHCSVDFLMERDENEFSVCELKAAKDERNFINLYKGIDRENQELICKLMENLANRS